MSGHDVMRDAAGAALSGSMASGVATLVGGTVTVSWSGVTADTRFFLGPGTGTLNLGSVSVSARSAGVSFTMLSTNVLDTRAVAWLAIEP